MNQTPEPIDPATLTERMYELVPVAKLFGIEVVEMGEDGSAVARLPLNPDFVRPGGSVSGPALMALADIAMFAGVNGKLGWTPMALTATLNTTFLRPPKMEPAIATATPLRFGRRLVFFAVSIESESEPGRPVAHITGSYALPQ